MLAFGAFPLIAILVLHAGPAEVSVLAAAGLAAGAAVAAPFGPWVEFRRKRPVMGLVSAEQAQEWRKATSSEFTFIELPGDHMYLVDRAQEVLDLIEAKSVDG